jgi:hypothetical protein
MSWQWRWAVQGFGDRAAFRIVSDVREGWMGCVCVSMDRQLAEDVLQDNLSHSLEALPTFDRRGLA